MIEIIENGWKLTIFAGPEPVDPAASNVDIEVELSDGRRFSATLFTPANLREMLKRGGDDTLGGLCFSCPDLVVVRDVSPDTIRRIVRGLVASGDLETAFARLESQQESDAP